MMGLDVILGMDWVHTNRVVIGYWKKKMKTTTPEDLNLVIQGMKRFSKRNIFFSLKAHHLLSKGGVGYPGTVIE